MQQRPAGSQDFIGMLAATNIPVTLLGNRQVKALLQQTKSSRIAAQPALSLRLQSTAPTARKRARIGSTTWEIPN